MVAARRRLSQAAQAFTPRTSRRIAWGGTPKAADEHFAHMAAVTKAGFVGDHVQGVAPWAPTW